MAVTIHAKSNGLIKYNNDREEKYYPLILEVIFSAFIYRTV